MTTSAKITVTTGPDRGKSCAVIGDLTRVGRGSDNDLVLTDSELADHLASIVQREGRYAIITTIPAGLEIDGTEIPVERWVWLPEEAQIRVSRRTALQFVQGNGAEDPSAESDEPVASVAAPASHDPGDVSGTDSSELTKPVRPAGRRSASGSSVELPRPKRSAAERTEKRSRTVARFITDGPGDPLVKLGEDGHLPELALKEGHTREGRETQAKQTNPLVLAVAIFSSIGLTLLMLLMDSGGFGDNTVRKADARSEIAQYYGDEGESLKPYQIHLRQARQARGRGDFDAERNEFRDVLALLRSEAKEKVYRYTGLTGRLDYSEGDANPKSDRRLEELIAILMSE